MQIAFGLRRQTPQFFGSGSPLAQLWNERFGASDHGRIGEVVAIRPPGRAYVWLLAGTCHVRSSLAPLLWSSCEQTVFVFIA
jgi:hypothetical protein